VPRCFLYGDDVGLTSTDHRSDRVDVIA